MPQITVYTTAACSYCRRAKDLLREKNLAFTEIAVDGNPRTLGDMTARAHGRMSVPQIFLGDIHIGDCEELHELDRDGKLDELLDGGAQ
jgi:glutaredoxin 3